MNIYKLFGFINMFDVTPDFAIPIFRRNQTLYLQKMEKNHTLSIVPLTDDLCHLVKHKSYFDVLTFSTHNIIMSPREKPKYAFQLSEDIIIYGEAKIFLNFFKHYQCNDRILKQEIADFINDVSTNTENVILSSNQRNHETNSPKHRLPKATVISVTNNNQSNKRIGIINASSVIDKKANATLIASKHINQISSTQNASIQVPRNVNRRLNASKGKKIIKAVKIRKNG